MIQELFQEGNKEALTEHQTGPKSLTPYSHTLPHHPLLPNLEFLPTWDASWSPEPAHPTTLHISGALRALSLPFHLSAVTVAPKPAFSLSPR